jgi:hypothetical protein
MAKWESMPVATEQDRSSKWESMPTEEQNARFVASFVYPTIGDSQAMDRANEIYKKAQGLQLPLDFVDKHIVEPEKPLTMNDVSYWIRKGYSETEAMELAQPSQEDVAAKLYGEQTFFKSTSILPATYKGALTATDTFLSGIEDIANLIGNKFGLSEPEKGGFFRRLGGAFAEKAEFWEKVLKDQGANGVERLVGEVAGGFVPGAYEFGAGVPYAFATGAAQADKEGKSALWGGAKSAVNRYILGKLLNVFSVIKNPYVRRSLGASTFGIDTALMGGSATDIGVQTLLGAFLTGYQEKAMGIKSKETITPPAIKLEKSKEVKPAKEVEMGKGTTKQAEVIDITKAPEIQIIKGKTPSRLAERTEEAAIEAKLTEGFGELAGYEKTEGFMKKQATKAVETMNKDYELAKKMALGLEAPPSGLKDASIYKAVENRATKENDIETLRSLATQSTIPTILSEYGREIKAADTASVYSPVRQIRDVVKAREKAVERGLRKGEKIDTMKERIRKEVMDTVKKSGSRRPDWVSFIEQIRCN